MIKHKMSPLTQARMKTKVELAMFNASPETARKYSSITTAKQSAGIGGSCVLPIHLELHRMESKRTVLSVVPIVVKQTKFNYY